MIRKLLALSIVAVAVAACETPKLTLEYRTQTIEELSGATSVNEFTFHAQDGKAQNLIPNTAAGEGVLLPETVGQFASNAFKRELRQAGVSLKAENGCAIDGEIHEILIDDLGFTVRLVFDTSYKLMQNENTLYQHREKTELSKLTKFVAPAIFLNNLNRMFSDNFKAVLTDPKFGAALSNQCKK